MKKLFVILLLMCPGLLQAQDFRHRYFHYDQIYTDPDNAFLIKASTVDGADNKYMSVCGGGECLRSRGGYLEIYGNEHGGLGALGYITGNQAGGNHFFYTGNLALRLTIPYLADADDADFLLGSASTTAPVFTFRPQTADADDDASIIIAAGGGNSYTRGAYISMTGNEAAGAGNQGSVYIRAGDDADGHIYFTTSAAYTRLTIPYLADADDVNLVLGSVATTAPIFTMRGQTADGDDDGSLCLTGGGGCADSRGGYVQIYGNEAAAINGTVRIYAGNKATSDVDLRSPQGNITLTPANSGYGVVFGDASYNSGFGFRKFQCEAVTVAVGAGAAGVNSATNWCTGIVWGLSARVTDAPGGGATTFNLGCTGSGNPDQFCSGLSTALSTTCQYPTNGDGTNSLWVQQTPTTATITTDSNVTGDNMIIRVCGWHGLMNAPTS